MFCQQMIWPQSDANRLIWCPTNATRKLRAVAYVKWKLDEIAPSNVVFMNRLGMREMRNAGEIFVDVAGGLP